MFDLLLINVSGMSLFPFDIAKVRQYSEQNKLFADFRLNYMRHGSQFVTRNQGGVLKRAAKLRFFPKTPSLSAKNRQITWTDAEKCLILHLDDHDNTSKYEKKNVLPAH